MSLFPAGECYVLHSVVIAPVKQVASTRELAAGRAWNDPITEAVK